MSSIERKYLNSGGIKICDSSATSSTGLTVVVWREHALTEINSFKTKNFFTISFFFVAINLFIIIDFLFID